MDDFEKIFNSIYAENQSKSLNENKNGSENSSSSTHNKSMSDEEVFAAFYSGRKQAKALYSSDENSESISTENISDINDNTEVETDDNNNNFSSPEESISESDDVPEEIDASDIDSSKYDDFGPKSFADFLSSRFAGLLVKIRGGVPADAITYTGEEDVDELGKEVSVKVGCKYYGEQSSMIRVRILISLGALFFLVYTTLGLPIVGSLNNITVASAFCLLTELSIIVFCLDVFTNGITNIFHGRLGANSLASLSCIISAVDACMVLTGTGTAHMPLCLFSSMSLIGVLMSSYFSARGIRKTLRVPSISKQIYTVTGEMGITGKSITLLKSKIGINGFVRRVEEEPLDECVYRKVAPIIIVLSIASTVLIAFFKHSVNNFFYIFTSIFCASVPIATLLPYSLSFLRGAFHVFPSGAAFAGWSGLCDIGHSKNLIVTDRDLFPEKSVEILNVRIFANYDADKIMSYAASLIRESKCGLYEAFTILLKENNISEVSVENFECLAGGGFKGIIDGHSVCCGSVDLMRLMNIKIPAKLIDGPAVLLSIDNVLYGIFNINYKPNAKVRRALVNLMGSNRHPIFAIRDFNVTPDLIRDVFDVATDGYDFPPYLERFPLSEAKPSDDSKVAGIVCREGLGPLIVLADTGRSLYVIIKICTFLSVLSAFIGLIGVSLSFVFENTISILIMFLFFVISFFLISLLALLGSSFN